MLELTELVGVRGLVCRVGDCYCVRIDRTCRGEGMGVWDGRLLLY